MWHSLNHCYHLLVKWVVTKAYKLCLKLVRRQYKIIPINRAGTSIDIAKLWLSAVRLSHFNSLPAPQVGAFHGRLIRGQARVKVYNVTQHLINMRTEYNLQFKLTEETSLTICVANSSWKIIKDGAMSLRQWAMCLEISFCDNI